MRTISLAAGGMEVGSEDLAVKAVMAMHYKIPKGSKILNGQPPLRRCDSQLATCDNGLI